ncbi:sulfite exporter TauE/SafE family protein [Streptomyces sp. GLT-R25]
MRGRLPRGTPRPAHPTLVPLAITAALGGATGAALLLGTPSKTFELVVPWLIALGSGLILAREPLRRLTARLSPGQDSLPKLPLACAVLLVRLYGGYFGAAAGVLMLAVLSLSTTEPLRVTNAVKNIATGAANVTAAVAYAFLAPVDWSAALALGLGCFAGAWMGPAVVRRLPEAPLRIAIALAWPRTRMEPVARGNRILNADQADYTAHAAQADHADRTDTVRCVCPDVGVCLPSGGGFAPDT